MATAKDVLRIAATEIGYTESPAGSNKTKFAAEAGHANGQPWCATWVVAMFRRAGIKLPSESAWTPSMYAAMDKVRGGMPGDVVFFDFPGDARGIQHVGILEGATASNITCIEGNTNPGDAGSQSNGGGVYRRTRPRSVVAGIGRPVYTKEFRPMFDPPHVLEPIVASLACPTGGFWLFGQHGGIYGYEGAPVSGSATGKSYFVGRSTAYGQLVDGFATPQIVATSGEKYGPAGF